MHNCAIDNNEMLFKQCVMSFDHLYTNDSIVDDGQMTFHRTKNRCVAGNVYNINNEQSIISIGVSDIDSTDRDELVEDAMTKAYMMPSITISIDRPVDTNDPSFDNALHKVLNGILETYPKRPVMARRNNVPVDYFEYVMNTF